jgi:hypothetical protein
MADSLASRALRVLRTEGVSVFIRKSTRFCVSQTRSRWGNSKLREFLPKTGAYQTYNDVVVEEKRIGEGFLNMCPDDPSYEGQLVKYIRSHIDEGDSVVVIGGYHGVSTIAAATQAGDHGSVTTFEATPKGADRVRKTARLNDVQQLVTVKAASVGPIYNPKGRDPGDSKIPPSELPDCDVLVIDCDGCELDVLDGIEITPRTIIVEHHGELYDNKYDKEGLDFEYQREELDDILSSKGYKIIDENTRARTIGGFEDQIGVFVAERST